MHSVPMTAPDPADVYCTIPVTIAEAIALSDAIETFAAEHPDRNATTLAALAGLRKRVFAPRTNREAA